MRKRCGGMWVRLSHERLSCPQYGSETYSPSITEDGMQDYRLDAIEQPERHLIAVDRLTGRRRSVAGDHSSGELPGHKVDGRR
jgi:hypothetical protein